MAYKGAFRAEKQSDMPKRNNALFYGENENEQILSKILNKIKAIDLESDDLLLMLILYLMYRESGDKEMLLMMGAMLFS